MNVIKGLLLIITKTSKCMVNNNYLSSLSKTVSGPAPSPSDGLYFAAASLAAATSSMALIAVLPKDRCDILMCLPKVVRVDREKAAE